MADDIFDIIKPHECLTPQKKEMLDRVLDVNQKDCDEFTLLYFAILNNNIDLVKYLLDRGADLDIICNNSSCLHASIKNDDMFALILDRSAKHLNFHDDCGSTPLHCAVIHGSLHVIHTLLDRGVNCNALDTIGQTPLHYIVDRQQLNVVQLLLNHGADPDIIDIEGHTAKDVLIKYLDRKDVYIFGPKKENILEIVKLLDLYSQGICTKRA